MNTVRQIKNFFWWYEFRNSIKSIAKRIFRGTPLNLQINRLKKQYCYATFPAVGPFFEYRLTPKEFLAAIKDAGFTVIKHIPVGDVDGMYHELNPFKRGCKEFCVIGQSCYPVNRRNDNGREKSNPRRVD